MGLIVTLELYCNMRQDSVYIVVDSNTIGIYADEIEYDILELHCNMRQNSVYIVVGSNPIEIIYR